MSRKATIYAAEESAIEEMTLASPAVANGSLFIRTATKLYRITKR